MRPPDEFERLLHPVFQEDEPGACVALGLVGDCPGLLTLLAPVIFLCEVGEIMPATLVLKHTA